MSPHIAFRGWGLPGGGVDHGEHPRDALRREVYEESGLHVEPRRLLDVYHHHYTGPRPDGLVEDFHAVGLIFEAELLPESRQVEPHVVDVGGSTDEARWFPLAETPHLSLSGSARFALSLIDPETAAPPEPAPDPVLDADPVVDREDGS